MLAAEVVLPAWEELGGGLPVAVEAAGGELGEADGDRGKVAREVDEPRPGRFDEEVAAEEMGDLRARVVDGVGPLRGVTVFEQEPDGRPAVGEGGEEVVDLLSGDRDPVAGELEAVAVGGLGSGRRRVALEQSAVGDELDELPSQLACRRERAEVQELAVEVGEPVGLRLDRLMVREQEESSQATAGFEVGA